MIVIGIAGGTSSGKTLSAIRLNNYLNENENISYVISSDNFYKSLKNKDPKNHNFDSPEAIDFEMMRDCILKIKNYENDVKIPIYDFISHQRLEESENIENIGNIKVLIVEGILIFNNVLLNLFDIKLFIQTDDDIRLFRRIKRDMATRGRDIDSVMHQWITTVKPSHDKYVQPSSNHADLIIPMTRDNVFIGLDFVCKSVMMRIKREI